MSPLTAMQTDGLGPGQRRRVACSYCALSDVLGGEVGTTARPERGLRSLRVTEATQGAEFGPHAAAHGRNHSGQRRAPTQKEGTEGPGDGRQRLAVGRRPADSVTRFPGPGGARPRHSALLAPRPSVPAAASSLLAATLAD